MGYHATVQAELVALLDAGVPRGVPVLNGLAVSETEAERLAQFVFVVRDGIEFDPHQEINPDVNSTQQPEQWTWTIDVKGGAGAARLSERGAEVDLLLESVRTAIGARKMTDCGPLHLVSEDYAGTSGAGVVYRQTWTHERF